MRISQLFFGLSLLAISVPALADVAPPPPPPPPVAKMTADECAVWNRELAFAQSVDNHDTKAFASFLLPGTVFDAGGPTPTRGAAQVSADWAPIIEGKAIIVRWRPQYVTIGEDPNIAVSRGPATIERTAPDAKVKFKTVVYGTIWTRANAKSPWMILFDGLGTNAVAVDDRATMDAHLAAAPKTCPQ